MMTAVIAWVRRSTVELDLWNFQELTEVMGDNY
jgi:hypothetical protein